MALQFYEEEKERVRRCLAGEPEAWRQFVDRYAPFIVREIRFTLRRLGRREDPALLQDLFQDSFRALLRDRCAALRDFRWESSLEHYLSVIAVYETVRSLKHQPSLRSLESVLLDKGDSAAPPADPSQVRDRLRKALSRLTPHERLALQLHYWDGLSTEGISRLLVLQTGSVRSLLTRARQRLEELLRTSLCL